MSKKIAVLVGSLRKDSLNKKMAKALAFVAPSSLSLEIIDLAPLSMYNQDLDEIPPEAWTHFRQKIKAAEAVLFVTPEYNRSIPGVLKNAIDIGSRPYGKSVWDGKPGAVISVSPSAMGGFGANHHLRQTLVFLNVPVLQQPEAYIGKANEMFNEKGEFASEDTKKFAQKFMEAFDKWIKINTSFR